MYHVCCRVCRHGSYDNVHDLGSLQADLIHLGARYSPCMRADENVIAAIEQDRDAERRSACCVRNDGSGCHQTTLATCSVRSRPHLSAIRTKCCQFRLEYHTRADSLLERYIAAIVTWMCTDMLVCT